MHTHLKTGKKRGEKKEKTDDYNGHYIIASSRLPKRRPLEHRTLVPKEVFSSEVCTNQQKFYPLQLFFSNTWGINIVWRCIQQHKLLLLLLECSNFQLISNYSTSRIHARMHQRSYKHTQILSQYYT